MGEVSHQLRIPYYGEDLPLADILSGHVLDPAMIGKTIYIIPGSNQDSEVITLDGAPGSLQQEIPFHSRSVEADTHTILFEPHPNTRVKPEAEDWQFLEDPDFSELHAYVVRKGHEFYGLHRTSKAASSEEQLRFLHTAVGHSSALDPHTRNWYDRFMYYDAIKLGETALTQKILVPALGSHTVQTSSVFRRPEIRQAVVEHMADRNAPVAVAIRGLQQWLKKDGVKLRPATVSLSNRTYEHAMFGIYLRDLCPIVEDVAERTLSTH